ncbi:GNAT family N-acetyltransferase [Streptomyces sp. NPDC057638]|uniref:GNAT family N-acetyltransferase n=1 Tax=Streptomyces sp. NPDC057638 TaxID=3346190 RepID=UPI003673B61E
MLPDTWHLTHDVDDHLAHAGDFLRSRPVQHTMQLYLADRLQKRGADGPAGAEPTVFGRLERDGEVRATFSRRASRMLSTTALTAGEADGLAAYLAGRGERLTGFSGEFDTGAVFADAWRRHTGATTEFKQRLHLYHLGTLTPPEPFPEGRARQAGAADREELIRWCQGFCAAVGESPAPDGGTWDDSRFGDRNFTFWERGDGTPVSLAAATDLIGGMVRVDPVYTPADLRGRGYAAAVTVAASRAARAAGAREVVLFTDPANPTSNALYQRLGFVRVTDFGVHSFS